MATKQSNPADNEEGGVQASREVASPPPDTEADADIVLVYQFKQAKVRPAVSTYHGGVPADDLTRAEATRHIRTKDALASVLEARTADGQPVFIMAEGKRLILPDTLDTTSK